MKRWREGKEWRLDVFDGEEWITQEQSSIDIIMDLYISDFAEGEYPVRICTVVNRKWRSIMTITPEHNQVVEVPIFLSYDNRGEKLMERGQELKTLHAKYRDRKITPQMLAEAMKKRIDGKRMSQSAIGHLFGYTGTYISMLIKKYRKDYPELFPDEPRHKHQVPLEVLKAMAENPETVADQLKSRGLNVPAHAIYALFIKHHLKKVKK